MRQALQLTQHTLLYAIAVLAAVWWQPTFLEYRVLPDLGVDINVWLDGFVRASLIGLGASGILAIAWYALGEWIAPVTEWTSAGKRGSWLFFLACATLTAAYAAFMVPTALEGSALARGFIVLTTILPFYLSTALVGPDSYKYSPLGASLLRHW